MLYRQIIEFSKITECLLYFRLYDEDLQSYVCAPSSSGVYNGGEKKQQTYTLYLSQQDKSLIKEPPFKFNESSRIRR